MQYWYILPLLFLTIVNGHLSVKAGISAKYFYILIPFQMIPLWPFVARFSKNIIVDAMVYDTLVAIAYAVALIIFSDVVLKPTLVIGVVLTVLGIILICH